MAAAPNVNVRDEDFSQDETWRKIRLEKVDVAGSSSSENAQLKHSVHCLQETVIRLGEKLSSMNMMNRNVMNQNTIMNNNTDPNSLLENKLINHAQKRLRFDIKDVHNSIDSWNHFFSDV